MIHLTYASGISQLISDLVLNEQCHKKTSPIIMQSFLSRGESPKLGLNFGDSLATERE